MRKRIKQFTQICIVIILFFFSFYGVYLNSKKDKSNRKEKNERFFKSNYFINSKTPLVGFVQDNNNIKENTFNQVKQLCDYTKLPFYTIQKQSINSKENIFPNTLKTIFLTNANGLNNVAIKNLLTFVANGGSLIITTLPTNTRLFYLIGLHKKRSKHTYNITAKGVFFDNNFTPNLNKTSILKEIAHYGYNKSSFNNHVRTILSASNEKNYPVLVENKIGLGKVILFNTTLEISKIERGLLFPNLLSTIEGIPYPVANVNTIFLDDFPSPVFPFVKEPIRSEYNISSEKFVKDIWWPNMLDLARKHNIQYTTTAIFDYDENAEPPFSYKQWNAAQQNFTPIPHLITKDVLKKNHELGFHGYNHVSFLKNNWEEENIRIALKTVKNMWQLNNYGDLPTSYIPPTNRVDRLGILTLNEELPSIKYLCSLYSGNFIEGGNREFNPEPYTYKMFDFPRNTSGFYMNNFKKYLKESMFLFTGIWSHFVHPDDIYQIPDKSNLKFKGEFNYRNAQSLNWKKTNANNLPGMYHTFEKIIQKHKNNYPFTSFPDVRKAGKLVAKLRSNHFQHSKTSSTYQVKNLDSNPAFQNWFTYVSHTHSKTLIKSLEKTNTPYTKLSLLEGYLINIKTPNSTIKLPIIQQKKSIEITSILNDFYEFLNYKETSEDIYENALNHLRKRIFSENVVSLKLWKEYAKYSSWTKTEKQFWADLNTLYYKHQNFDVANLAILMSKHIWYPSEKSKLKWLERQLITTNNLNTKLNLLKNYIKNYNTKNNISKIRRKLKEIAQLEPSRENNIAYISSYLWSDDDAKFPFLYTLPAIQSYEQVATEISWYFLEKKQLNKALEWASLSKEIPIQTQLYWIFESKNHHQLDTYFHQYNYTSEQERSIAQKTMVDLYLARDQFIKAWELAKQIPNNHKDYKTIREKLNTYFLYQNRKTKKRLLQNDSFLYKHVKDSLQRLFMLEENTSTKISSAINTNRNDIVSFDKSFTYSHITTGKRVHNFSFTHSLVNNIIDKNEPATNLYGINYKFENSKLFNEKFRYSGQFGLETDKYKYFYLFNILGSYNFDKSLLSFQYNLTPVKNVIAFKDFLYKNTLSFYFEKNFNGRINTTAYLESNYYTDYNKDITLSLAANYPIYTFQKNLIRLTTEGSYSLGSTNNSGIPYWMVTKRHFLGGGLQYQLNTDIDKTYILLDGMFFYDSYSEYFSRYRAKINFQLQKNFIVNFSGELFKQDLYYSNTFNIGLSYYL